MCQQTTTLAFRALSYAWLVQNINHSLQDGPVVRLAYKSLVLCHPCLGPEGRGIGHGHSRLGFIDPDYREGFPDQALLGSQFRPVNLGLIP